MKAVAIIPARFASSRFPGKPLAKILDAPMVVHVYRRVREAVETTVVATDDDRIETVCRSFDIPVVRTSSDAMTGTDRVAEAAAQLDADIILNVQGDEPLIRPEDIGRVLAEKARSPDVVVNAMSPLKDQAEWLSRDVPKVVCAASGDLLYMSRAAIPVDKSGNFHGGYKQVCIYAFTPEELRRHAGHGDKTALEAVEDIEILRFLELGMRVKMV